MRAGIVTLLTAALAAPMLHAQALDDVCRPLERPRAGAWAAYRLRTAAGDSTDVRLALVGRVTTPDGEHVWQESVLRRAGTETVIQSLVPADPYDPATIRRAVIRAPGREPLELPPSALAMMRDAGGQGPAGMDACRDGRAVGWETVDVPAGTVRALHVRYLRDGRTADSWLAPGIPFALVRTVVAGDADTLELTLVAHGGDAQPTAPLPGEAR